MDHKYYRKCYTAVELAWSALHQYVRSITSAANSIIEIGALIMKTPEFLVVLTATTLDRLLFCLRLSRWVRCRRLCVCLNGDYLQFSKGQQNLRIVPEALGCSEIKSGIISTRNKEQTLSSLFNHVMCIIKSKCVSINFVSSNTIEKGTLLLL